MRRASDPGYKLVVVVRKDLKLSPGKLAAQVAHAAVDCALRAKETDADSFSKWHREGQKKVVVAADDLRHLHELKVQADDWNVVTSLVTDAGQTEVEPGTVTALGVGPGKDTVVDAITGELPLMR